MSGDIDMQGHTLSPIFGLDGARYGFCSCSDDERFDGVTSAEVEDLHRQHCERIHDALVAPLARDAARRGIGRAREALAATLGRKETS